ncbi:unnamed protein product [Lymnaea stagnalis]|uniref:Peptidase M13 C-terminal domain-containing protein n=1 Tax=Lymnaea stagnalis TaxID=6523 RepID=A0AAV2I3L0_LYMST
MVNSVAQNVRQQMLATIDRTTWLEEPLRKKLLEKAQDIDFFCGYSDWIIDAKSLDDYYANFEVVDDELLNATTAAMREVVKKLYKGLTETRQLTTAVDLGFFAYDPFNNTVFFTIDQFQQPLFEPSFSKKFLYGGLGYVFGHEVTHAFDVLVRKWDKNGLPVIDWPPHSDEEYLKRVKCLTDQYSSKTLYGIHLSGNYTVQEDICDNNAVRLAYKAFKALELSSDPIFPGLNLTDDQTFFLSYSQKYCRKASEEFDTVTLKYYGDTHSPSPYRVNMTLSNYPAFAKAFNCPLGSPMNPVKKCAVWE